MRLLKIAFSGRAVFVESCNLRRLIGKDNKGSAGVLAGSGAVGVPPTVKRVNYQTR